MTLDYSTAHACANVLNDVKRTRSKANVAHFPKRSYTTASAPLRRTSKLVTSVALRLKRPDLQLHSCNDASVWNGTKLTFRKHATNYMSLQCQYVTVLNDFQRWKNCDPPCDVGSRSSFAVSRTMLWDIVSVLHIFNLFAYTYAIKTLHWWR